MANFLTALKITGGTEGGYANNPDDSGGETFAGIARNFWPNWSGWKLIDAYKEANGSFHGINELLSNPDMIADIQQFYKTNFWDVNSLDLINDQQVANTTYDCGVNSGTGIAAEFLQKAAGVVADRIVGARTIEAVNADSGETIYNSINAQRKARYLTEAQEPGQGQFLKSWLSRLTPYQS
jgi:lysozyme family protein